jgi:hypothetical protein
MYPKIFFGRKPKEPCFSLDSHLMTFMNEDANLEQAVEDLVSSLEDDKVYHTINPFIPNYLEDDHAARLFWILDENGNEIYMKDDEWLIKKLPMMGPGYALADDARAFNDNNTLKIKK